MAVGDPGAICGMGKRRVLAPPRAPPRWLVLRTTNILRAAGIRTSGCDAATVLWLPPEHGGTKLTVAHFKKGGPTYDDALSRLGYPPGPLLVMLPTDLAAALRQELDGYDRLKVGWDAVADGALLSLLHRGTADGCRLDALVPHQTDVRPIWRRPRGTPARSRMRS